MKVTSVALAALSALPTALARGLEKRDASASVSGQLICTTEMAATSGVTTMTYTSCPTTVTGIATQTLSSNTTITVDNRKTVVKIKTKTHKGKGTATINTIKKVKTTETPVYYETAATVTVTGTTHTVSVAPPAGFTPIGDSSLAKREAAEVVASLTASTTICLLKMPCSGSVYTTYHTTSYNAAPSTTTLDGTVIQHEVDTVFKRGGPTVTNTITDIHTVWASASASTVVPTHTSIPFNVTVAEACSAANYLNATTDGSDSSSESGIGGVTLAANYEAFEVLQDKDAVSCCTTCFLISDCVLSYMTPEGLCYLVASTKGVCNITEPVASFYANASIAAGSGYTVSNGPCGSWSFNASVSASASADFSGKRLFKRN